MSNLILLFTSLVIIIYSIVKLWKKVTLPTMISFNLFNLSFILSIVILIYYRSTSLSYLDILTIVLMVSLVVFIFFAGKEKSINFTDFMNTIFSSFIIANASLYILLLVIKTTSNEHFALQLAIIIIGLTLYFIIQLTFRKFNISKYVYSEKFNISRLTVFLTLIIILGLICTINEPYNQYLDEVYLENVSDSDNYILMPKIRYTNPEDLVIEGYLPYPSNPIYFDESETNYIIYYLDESYVINNIYKYINNLSTQNTYIGYYSLDADNTKVVYYTLDYESDIETYTEYSLEIEYYTFNNYHIQYESKLFYLGIVFLFIPVIHKKKETS